jgi:hypothetical protein
MRTRLGAFGVLLLWGLASVAGASLTQDLAKAAERQKIAFVLVTESTVVGVDEARDLIRSAMKQVKESTMLELDRADPANADLVAQHRLAGAPLPVILVFARSGVLAGGFAAAQGTVERLVGLVPSPKKVEMMQCLQGGKAVFAFMSRQGMRTSATALAACQAASDRMGGKSVVIPIDMDDPAETGFLKQLKIDLAATEPVTLVVNAQGQLTGTYTGAPDVAALVQAAEQRATGCCPSTVQNPNASCAPPKK